MKSFEEAVHEAYHGHFKFIQAWCCMIEAADRDKRDCWAKASEKAAAASCAQQDLIAFIYGKSDEEVHDALHRDLMRFDPALCKRYLGLVEAA